MTAFQIAVLKNAGVKNIPDSIIKVPVKEPKVVKFLSEEPTSDWKHEAVEGFFGPFEVFQPEMDILENEPGMVLFLEEEVINQVFTQNLDSGNPLSEPRAFPESPRNAPRKT